MTTTVTSRSAAYRARAPRRLLLDPNAALAAIAAGAVAVIGLWWQDTEFVYGLGSWLTNAGRIIGLLCGYAVVVLVALMARVPALEHGIGSDRLARWHAAGGRYTVCLAVAHTLLIIWGYAVSAHTGLMTETGSLLTAYPDVLMATVALGLLVGVGITSARAARRRLRYETWHTLHLYTYLAVALAFSHQFATGADFVDARVRWLWSAMYIVVGATLLWFRVVKPLSVLSRYALRVVAVIPHNRDVVSVLVRGHNLDRLRAESGQFFRWRFLTRDLWWAANPYSLSAAPRSDHLRITVKIAGEHSGALARLKPGTRVLAEGPYGAFTDRHRRAGKVLLIGVGIGITPLRALLESVPAEPGRHHPALSGTPPRRSRPGARDRRHRRRSRCAGALPARAARKQPAPGSAVRAAPAGDGAGPRRARGLPLWTRRPDRAAGSHPPPQRDPAWAHPPRIIHLLKRRHST